MEFYAAYIFRIENGINVLKMINNRYKNKPNGIVYTINEQIKM